MARLGRQWRIALGGIALLALGGFYLWSRQPPTAQAPVARPPEIPASVVDPDVRAALEGDRAKVLAAPESGQAWGELGLTYRAHNLNSESNACFAVAAKLEPQNPRWPYLIGVINLLIAPDDALPHLKAAYERATEPDHKSLIRLRLAEALLDRNDLDGAAKLFTQEALANPLDVRAQFGLGAVAAARGDDRAAINSLTLATESPFTHRKANALLAASHRRLGNTALAERHERQAALAPDDLPWPDAFLSEYIRREAGRSARMKAAEEYEASGEIAAAVRELDSIARATPDDQVLVSLGINLAKMGNFAQAERILRDVVARAPEHAVAHYFLGISLFMPAERALKGGDRDWAKPRLEEAVKELRRSAELKPDKGLAHLYAGLALKHLRNLPEAEAECRAAVRVSPQLVDCHLGLAEVLIEAGKAQEAIPSAEAAARLAHPKDTRAKTMLEKLRPKQP